MNRYVNIGRRSGEQVSRILWLLSNPDAAGGGFETTHSYSWITGSDGNNYLIVPEDFEALVSPQASSDAFAGVFNAQLRGGLEERLAPSKGRVVPFREILPATLMESAKTRQELIDEGVLTDA
jgi:hypothetical protein